MKIILIFSTILSALVTKATKPVTIKPFDSISFSPLYLGKNSTFVIKGGRTSCLVKFYISNDLFTKQLIGQTRIGKTEDVILSYDNAYTRSTNQIIVEYKMLTTTVSSEPITMKVASSRYIYLNDNQSFEANENIKILLGSPLSWSTRKMTYGFTNFDGVYIPAYYHKIDLSDFKISVSAHDKDLFSCNPSLVINNVGGVFNDISTASSIEFPLNLVSSSGTFSFELQNLLYVHRETLLMSATQKDGYVPTKHIYFPRNQMQDQVKYRAYFALQNFGIDKDFVKHNFQFKALKNTVGDCQNSQYCIQRL